mgnify:CR=1 FL=1
MSGLRQMLLCAVAGAGLALGGATGALAAVQTPAQNMGGDNPPGYEYFIRPVIQYDGAVIDGLDLDGASAGAEVFNDGTTSLQTALDLGNGTIKLFASMWGPSESYGIATGILGDVIRYTGAEDVPVSFRFDYDTLVTTEQQAYEGADPFSRYFAIEAYFAVYDASSSASWDNWTSFGEHADEALYTGFQFVNFNEDPDPDISSWFSGGLGADDLFLISGQSYKVYAAYNLVLAPGGDYIGEITLDALNTAAIGIDAPGGAFTSLSGSFLGFEKTPGDDGGPPVVPGVPEPASWAMLLLGFGLVGGTVRRRQGRRERQGRAA